ncbi:MAG TPA: hypothetical protein VKS79_09330 [Gemmataceae bacterium]|nr:hypothetical protein [Gemmataceae bacterium]
MAGYSGTPLPKKLGMKPGCRVLLWKAPESLLELLGEAAAEMTLSREMGNEGAFDIIMLFTDSRAELQKSFAKLARRLAPAGGLWVAWPKKASGVPTDLSEDIVREIGLKVGLVDNKVCAIDETWSGLRFVIRLADRPKQKAK